MGALSSKNHLMKELKRNYDNNIAGLLHRMWCFDVIPLFLILWTVFPIHNANYLEQQAVTDGILPYGAT